MMWAQSDPIVTLQFWMFVRFNFYQWLLLGFRPSESSVFEREPLLHMDDDADVDHFNKTHNSTTVQNNNHGSNSSSDLAEIPQFKSYYSQENPVPAWRYSPNTNVKCNSFVLDSNIFHCLINSIEVLLHVIG